MRIALLIVLIISALSKKFVDIYKTEKQIQKEALYKCILNSNELRENIRVIYGDIQKAFINHYYLDIIKKLVDYNPKNNKILIQCSNELIDKEDDIVLERSISSHSSGGSSSSSGSSPSKSSSSGSSSGSGKSSSIPSKSSIGSNKSSSGSNQPKTTTLKTIQPKSIIQKSTRIKSNILKSSRTKSSSTKSKNHKLTQNNPTERKPTQNKSTQNKPTENKSNQNKPTEHKQAQNKPTGHKQTQNKSTQNKPTENKPTQNKPTEHKPTQNKPSEHKPTENKPNDHKPNEHKPTEQKPTEHKPSENKPTEHKPIEHKPTEQKPTEQKPTEHKPTEPKPTENKQTEQKPTEHKPTEQKPTKHKPTEHKPTEKKPTEQKPTEHKPIEQKPTEHKPTEHKPSEKKPTEQKSTEHKSTDQKPTDHKPTDQKPTEHKPNDQKPTDHKPTDQKPIEHKPTDQKPTQSSTDKNDTKNKNKNPTNFQPLQWINNIHDKLNPKFNIKGKNIDIEAQRDSVKTKLNVGKNTEINANIQSDSVDVGGKTTISKGNQDTTYTLQGSLKNKDGQTDASIQGGKTTKTNEGPGYTIEGHQISGTGTYIDDGNKKGGGGSVTYTETHGKGVNIAGADVSNIDIRERTVSGQVTHSRDGKTEVSGGYTDTNTNKQAINVGGNEVSRSIYNTKSYEGNGSIQKTPYGYKGEGSFTRKDINGQTYQIGKTSFTQEQESGTVVNGGGSINKHGGNAHGSVENYDKTTYRMGYGDFQGEVSKKEYEKLEGNAAFSSRNGVVTGRAGASYAQGTQYTGKIGDAQVTGGIEDKTSARVGLRATKDGATANAQVQDSQRVSGGVELGKNIKADGSAGMTQTANAQATVNKNGASVKANYEEAYDAKLHAKVGNTDVGARAKFSDNTYGSASAQFKDGKFNAEAKVGKEYKVGAGLTVNGQNIVSADASLKGEASAKVKANKNGVAAQVGLDGQAQANVAFGQTEVKVVVKADFHFGISFDFKTGLHFDIGGGIHAEVDVIDKKTGKETDYKLFKSPGKPAYILYRKRRIVKKNMKKSQKNKILGQACRPSRHRS